MTERNAKKDGSIVIHCTKSFELRFKRIAEHYGLTPSEHGLHVLTKAEDKLHDDYLLLKSLFDLDQK
jgi:hypothetical protein